MSSTQPASSSQLYREVGVVIADDHHLLMPLLVRYCQDLGLRTYEAKDGVQALGLVSLNKPQLLITDFHMPKLTGLQLGEAVRAIGLTIPVIFMSSALTDDMKAELAKVSPFILSKPFNDVQFKNMVRLALAQPS